MSYSISSGFMAMEAINSKKITVMFLTIILAITLVHADSVQGHGISLIKEEELLELDRQLKIINKPAVKSFKTQYGDIIDCVEIYKQLAFDHPLLKNHTIQKPPQTTPEEMGNNEEALSRAHKSINYMPKNIKCPKGSVAIKRATRNDLIMAKSIKSLGLTHPSNAHSPAENDVFQGHHSAILVKDGGFGARARINIWKPIVKDNQFSSCGIWIANGSGQIKTSIQTGWLVVNNDNNSRLYTYWTADGYGKTGCFNIQCPGFVQTSSDIALGLVLQPSTYDGAQFDVLLSLYLDQASGIWWLKYEDIVVGYWPKLTIPALASGAHFMSWGGEVYSPILEPSPEMGSGHFPMDAFGVNHGKAAYFSQIQIVHSQETAKFEDPDVNSVKVWADNAICYNATMFIGDIQGTGYDLYYGGLGNCTYPSIGVEN